MWKLDAYRYALFLLDQMRGDLARLTTRDTEQSRDQLRRAVASIGSNLAEGYSRPTLADRARFYAYALGSVRESVWWYSALRGELGDEITLARFDLLSRLRRLITGLLKSIQSRLPSTNFTP